MSQSYAEMELIFPSCQKEYVRKMSLPHIYCSVWFFFLKKVVVGFKTIAYAFDFMQGLEAAPTGCFITTEAKQLIVR